MPKKEVAIKNSIILSAYLLVVWGFYRFIFKLPEELEELIVKPIFWLLPVLYLVKKEKLSFSSLGITGKNLFPSVYLALALGTGFAIEGVFINFLKYGEFNFSANIGRVAILISFCLSLVTAITEEITFRGYLFNRMWGAIGKEWSANILTSVIWGAVHVPIAIFWWNLTLPGAAGYLLLTTVFGVGSAFLFARTKNVVSSILLHVLWAWPIILFR